MRPDAAEGALPTTPIKCFVTFRLKPGVTVDAYLRWFRTENLAAVGTQTAIRNYRVWKRLKIHEGTPTWEFIEEMEVLDLERCEDEFTRLPAMQTMLARWYEMVADQVVVFAEEVAREP